MSFQFAKSRRYQIWTFLIFWSRLNGHTVRSEEGEEKEEKEVMNWYTGSVKRKEETTSKVKKRKKYQKDFKLKL